MRSLAEAVNQTVGTMAVDMVIGEATPEISAAVARHLNGDHGSWMDAQGLT